jgi:hypothetical protein
VARGLDRTLALHALAENFSYSSTALYAPAHVQPLLGNGIVKAPTGLKGPDCRRGETKSVELDLGFVRNSRRTEASHEGHDADRDTRAQPPRERRAAATAEGGQCPSGYRESGDYCAPTSDRSPDAAMSKRLDAERRVLHRSCKT